MEIFFGVTGLLMWLTAMILTLYIVCSVGFVINMLVLLTFGLIFTGTLLVAIANG